MAPFANWTDRSFGHSCSAPSEQPCELEIRCHDGEWGITEKSEAIGDLTRDYRWLPAAGPHLTPWVPEDLQRQLAGGQHDAGWDRSGMTRHRLAILPGVTHYDINFSPKLATAVAWFLDER